MNRPIAQTPVSRSSRSRRWWLQLLLWLFLASSGYAAPTLYMTVLSSRRHQWGKSQNPAVGLFISRDNGQSWQHLGWREAVRIFHVEVGPDGTIWCAAGNGILRSRDAGQTWRITTGWQITEVLKVRAVATDPNIVYAASAYGVFKTTDAGENWDKIRNGFASDLLVSRENPATILSASEDGVYISYNEGRNWDHSGLAEMGVRVLAQSAEHIWAGTENNGLFVRRQGDYSWRPMNKGLSDSTVYAIAVNPKNDRHIAIGTHGGGVFASADGGENWTQRINGLTNLTVHGLLYAGPHRLLAGTINGGLYESDDEGVNWKFNSQPDAQVWSLSTK